MARRSIVDNYIIRKKSVDVLEVIRLYAPQLTRLSRRSGETAPPDGPWAGPWEKWSGRRWAEAVRAALLRRFSRPLDVRRPLYHAEFTLRESSVART